MISNEDLLNLQKIISKFDLNRISSSQLILNKTIATGGQGKIKLGKYLNINVIVKLYHKINIKSFIQEVLNCYKYRHPNIPNFLGIYESDKKFGIVIEYIDGITLNKLIYYEKTNKINITLLQKLDYLLQLANVIEYLHSNNLMHRDLKTDNIMIDHNGNLKLIDFGIALNDKKKMINMDSPDYSLTPNYMAPEIAFQAQESDSEEEEENEEMNIIKFNKINNNIDNNKISETYNNKMKNDLLNNNNNNNKNNLFLINTSELKNVNYNIGKWILITYKYDIWTFGLIMAQIFTRCKPWCRNEKENISEMEVQTRILSNLPYPVFNLYPKDECEKYEKEIKNLIKECLNFDPIKRYEINKIKEVLFDIYKKEINNVNRYEKLKLMKEKRKKNIEFKHNFLDKIDNNDKNNIIRSNKFLIRNKIDIEKLNEFNKKINNKENKNLDNNNNIFNNNKYNYLNNENDYLLNLIIKQNLETLQKIEINKHIIFELEQKNNNNNNKINNKNK